MAVILQLGAGELMKHSIRQIQAMGHEVYVIDKNPNAPAFDIADGYQAIDLIDVDGITQYAKEISADAIIAVNEAGVLSAAKASKLLGLRGLDPEIAIKALDKGKMRQAWQKAGLSQPRFMLTNNADDIPDFASVIGYPVVVKPTMNWGSRGVSVAETADDLAWSMEFAANNHKTGTDFSVEEYIDGIEMTIEGIVYNREIIILAKSDKILQHHPRYRVDQSLHYPANLPDTILDKVDKLFIQAVEALNLNNCALHCEMRIKDEQPYLLEMAARPGGGHIFGQIVEAVSGISMPQALTNILLNEDFEKYPRYQHGAVYRFFTPPSGIFMGVDGLEEVRAMEGVLDFGFHMQVGTKVEPYADGASRPGYCVTSVQTREEAIAIAEKAVATLRYKMEAN